VTLIVVRCLVPQRFAWLFLCLLGLAACALEISANAGDNGTLVRGPENSYQAGYTGLTAMQRSGRDTWYFWTGGDSDAQGNVVGDQALWRILAVRSHGVVDLLQAVDSRYRGERFKRFGVINDPDCRKATSPDQYGLWLDNCAPENTQGPVGESAGIIGLRRFPNPKFDPKAWDLAKYMADPAKVEPPYLIGVACGFCHVGFNPLHPPADPEHPTWHNLHPGIGNQYFREQIFNTAKYPATRGLKHNDFRWQVANAEPPGTSDTSQVATDHIDNPSTINTIVDMNYRPMHSEVTADGVTRSVFHVLKDGADSVGAACLDDPAEKPGVNDTACAAMRGYLNIGVCAGVWTTLVDSVYGLERAQAPFDIKRARRESRPCDESFTATEARLEGLEAFLRTQSPLRLADADDGARYLPRDEAVLTRGKIVFAENCAQCHSSKRPPSDFKGSQVQWFRDAVEREDFLDGNFLSDDEKHPVSEIGTNAERALATNAERGQIWETFSSETFKDSPPVRIAGLVNPLQPKLRLPSIEATGGRGYYRTPSLVSLWATAPYLHNNSVGLYNGDPSVAGRLTAYENGMELLLWPERRLGLQSIHRTTEKSRFAFEEGSGVCVARNTPIDLITNVHVAPREHFGRDKLFDNLLCRLTGSGAANALFLMMDNAPDFVQDRGHIYGADLPDADKQALIEYMKTF
jgi:mono/diheme cytochrome c family protein